MLYTAVIKSYKFGGGICAGAGAGGTVDGRGGTKTGADGKVGDGRGFGGGREIEMLTDGNILVANTPS